MKILAIIITYHIDTEQIATNISAILPYVDKLMIWENTLNNTIATR